MPANRSDRLYAKKNERLIGTKMKKLVILLLVFSLLTLTSCGLFQKAPEDVTLIWETANKSKPTKVTTEVNYVTNEGDSLKGYYVTTTDGTDAIFEYYYEKLATPADSVATGNSDRIVSYEGTINYNNGVYSGNETEWRPGTGTAFDLKFDIQPAYLQDAVVNEDGNILEAKASAENLKSLIGTDLNCVGDATVTLSTNGVNLTALTVSCATENGTVTVRTSFTYNSQDLFPVLPEDVEGVEGEVTENT